MNDHTRNCEEDARVTELLREFDEAKAEEIESASRVASAIDELSDLGIDITKVRPGDVG